jgi:uncharacterized protein YggU (UPF0235/DUF167 family)
VAFVRTIPGGIELELWVVPRASHPGLGPLHGARLRVAVSAPPVDDAANEAVRTLIAEALFLPRGEVRIVRGVTGRNKTLRINGDAAALLLRAQSLAAASVVAAAEKVPKTHRGSDEG